MTYGSGPPPLQDDRILPIGTCAMPACVQRLAYIQRRLASSAAKLPSASTAHLKTFPPKDALFKHREIPKPPFSPETWASVQPPPDSALSAFAHRIGLASVLNSPESILQACTHPSFLIINRKMSPHASVPPTNAHLETIGNALMGVFASEFVFAAYPYLPTRVLKAAVTAHVGALTCASVAQEMGASHLVRWYRIVRQTPLIFITSFMLYSQPRTPTRPPVMHSHALASVPRALTALIYQKCSLPSARQFVHSYFLSREIDLRGMLKFRDPKKALLEMVLKLQRERPKSRYVPFTSPLLNKILYDLKQTIKRNRPVLKLTCVRCWHILRCRPTWRRLWQFSENGRIPCKHSTHPSFDTPNQRTHTGSRRRPPPRLPNPHTEPHPSTSYVHLPPRPWRRVSTRPRRA
jgi:large subunit ribosomal protein L44